jgi:DNA-binding response OmpR family regulator
MRILIVNIYSEIIEMIDHVHMITDICQPDWQVSVVDSGMQCLDVVKSGHCPDVIIMGMQLSDISGLDLIKIIRDDSDVPIMVISDDKDVHTLVAAFEAGANEYIVKPFSKVVFIARLKAIIRRRKWDIGAVESGLKNIDGFKRISQSLSGGLGC